MYKKVISLVLLIMLIFPAFLNVSNAQENTEKTSQMKFLELLGITYEVDRGSYEAEVSREDFAYYIAKANGLTPPENASNRRFIDVSPDCYAFSQINMLLEYGIISQGEDGLFRPNDTITYGEAYTMVLNSIGYKEKASAYGGWPLGYVKIARELGLGDRHADDKVVYNEATELIYDMLLKNLYSVKGISSDGISYEKDENTTLLSSVFSIYYDFGTVEAVYGCSMNTTTVMYYKNIQINGNEYDVSHSFDESGLCGSYVKYFYTEEDGRREVVFACEENNGKDEISVDIELYKGYDGSTLELYTDNSSGKTRKISLEKNHVIIYNGMPLSNHIKDTLKNLNKGSIALKDSNNDKEYDTVIIRDYKNFYLLSYDSLNNRIYNKLNTDEVITLGDKKYVKVIKNGKEVGIDDIEADSVLSVAPSINGEMTEIIIATTSVEGVVTYIDNDYIKIDGNQYEAERSYRESLLKQAKIGERYKFYFDNFGKISYMTASTDRVMTYAYLMSAAEDDFGEYVKLKLFNEKNEIVILKTADKIKIDGNIYKNADEIVDCFRDSMDRSKVKRQLIEYSLNSVGEINAIDTALVQNPTEDSEYSLRPVYDVAEAKWYQSGRYGLKGLFSDRTVAFYVPKEIDAENAYYRVGTYRELFPYETTQKCETYYRSENSGHIDVMVVEESIKETDLDSGIVIMVDELSEVLVDEEVMIQISGYSSGATKSVEARREICPSDLAQGDLVIAFTNNQGECQKVERVFDCDKELEPSAFKYDENGLLLYQKGNDLNYRLECQLSFGYALRKYDSGVVSWSRNPGEAESERADVTNIKITVYDKETEEVYLGNYSEIIDYVQSKNNCSKLFYHTYLGVGRGMYVYK